MSYIPLSVINAAIGSPEADLFTKITDITSAIVSDKTVLAATLNDKGVIAVPTESLIDLINKVVPLQVNFNLKYTEYFPQTVTVNNGDTIDSCATYPATIIDTLSETFPSTVTVNNSAAGKMWLTEKGNAVMTANNTPSAYLVSASTENAGYEAYKAFNNSNAGETDSWLTSSGTITGWVQYQLLPIKATGSITYGVPVVGDTVIVNGTTFTCAAVGSATEFSTIEELEALVEGLTGIDSSEDDTVVSIEASTFGAAGNLITLALGVGNTGTMSISGPTLTGGSGDAIIVIEYWMTSRNAANVTSQAPKDFTFQGSNNGSTWTTLDTRTGITTWSQNELKKFYFVNNTAYTYFKLDVTANNGSPDFVAVGELELRKSPTGTISF